MKIPPLGAVLIRADKRREGRQDGEVDRKKGMVKVKRDFCHYAMGLKMV